MSEMNNNPAAAPSETTGSSTISAARLAANRQNAQKSGGPTTPEGKATSCLNAVKCGLTSQFVLFTSTTELASYKAHVKSYETQFQPVGAEESALVQSIADIRWRLAQIPGHELAILATGSLKVIQDYPVYAFAEAETTLKLEVRRRHEKELRNLQLQENRLARRRERESAELDRRQAARQARELESLAEAAKASLLARHHKQPLAEIPGLGFVFSEKRYATYMSRLNPAQREKFLQEAIAEAFELPQTMEAAA